jgi:hypothetical protein
MASIKLRPIATIEVDVELSNASISLKTLSAIITVSPEF